MEVKGCGVLYVVGTPIGNLSDFSPRAQATLQEADFIAAPTSKPLIRISYTIREIFALWKYLLVGG